MTDTATITGSCLCGAVTFSIEDQFDHFQLCHCSQCQKTTGSAHASNLFTKPRCITWLSGQDAVTRFDLEGRRISNAFCNRCGSRLPFTSHSGDVLAVPAGCLNGAPSRQPQANIFWPERAQWYDAGLQAHKFAEFAEDAVPVGTYRIYAVRVFSQRWDEALTFYKHAVGFDVEYENPDIGWAQFRLGGAAIGLERLAPDDEEADDLVGRYVGVSIQVEDIDATYQDLRAKGVVFVAPPEAQPWGGILAHFQDPDGNVLTLLGGVTE